MSKDKAGQFRDVFAGLVAEAPELATALPVGKHVVTIEEIKEVESKGNDELFAGTTGQLAIVGKNENGSVTIYINLIGYVRKEDITSEMIEDIAAPAGVKAAAWNKMTHEDRVETLFSSYETPEGDNIAVANFDMEINGQEVEARNRIEDPDRTKKSLGKLQKLLVDVGVPKGTVMKGGLPQIVKALKGQDVGVSVVKGSLMNRKGKAMIKVEYTFPASEMEDLD